MGEITLEPGAGAAPAEEAARRRPAALPEQRLLAAGLRIAVAAAVAQGVAHTFTMLVIGGKVWNLNADEDGNALSWLGSMTILSAALGALLLATVVRDRRAPLLLAGLLTALSLDELIAVHERVGQHGREALDLAPELGRVLWPLLLLPVLAVVVAAGAATLRLLDRPSRRRIAAGAALLAAAVVLEMAWTSFFLAGGELRTWPDALQVSVEEGAELAGWILIASALLAEYVRRARTAPAAP